MNVDALRFHHGPFHGQSFTYNGVTMYPLWFVSADAQHVNTIHALAKQYSQELSCKPAFPISLWEFGSSSRMCVPCHTQFVIAVGTRTPSNSVAKPDVWFCIPLVKSYKFGPFMTFQELLQKRSSKYISCPN